jgi:hypothetical protein
VATGFAILGVISLGMIAGGVWSLADGGLTSAREEPWRWLLLPFSAGGFLTMIGLGLLTLMAWTALKKLRVTRACAKDSVEIELDVLSIQAIGATDSARALFSFQYLPPGTASKPKAAPAGEPMLVLRDDGPKLVALVSPRFPKSPVILNSSFYPFQLTPEQARAIAPKLWHATEAWARPTAPGSDSPPADRR